METCCSDPEVQSITLKLDHSISATCRMPGQTTMTPAFTGRRFRTRMNSCIMPSPKLNSQADDEPWTHPSFSSTQRAWEVGGSRVSGICGGATVNCEQIQCGHFGSLFRALPSPNSLRKGQRQTTTKHQRCIVRKRSWKREVCVKDSGISMKQQ